MQDVIENNRRFQLRGLTAGAAVVGSGLVLALAVSTTEHRRRQAARPLPTTVAAKAGSPARKALDLMPTAAMDIAWLHGTDRRDRLEGSDNRDLIDGYDGDDVMHGYGGDDRMSGGAGDDHLIGDSGDDHLNGGAGNDRLIGGDGDDTLEGAEGDDVLEGGSGDDTYVFGARFGHDVVRERARDQPGRDVLAFEKLTRQNARIEREDDDLVVRDRRSDDSTRVEGFFQSETHRVETLRFADGSQASLLRLSEAQRILELASN
jgi:hypothetical protein